MDIGGIGRGPRDVRIALQAQQHRNQSLEIGQQLGDAGFNEISVHECVYPADGTPEFREFIGVKQPLKGALIQKAEFGAGDRHGDSCQRPSITIKMLVDAKRAMDNNGRDAKIVTGVLKLYRV